MALVRDVVRDVIAETAPDELPVVEGLCRLGDDDRVVRALRRRPRGDRLGFGLGGTAVLVTAVVWTVLDEVTRRSIGVAVDGIGRRIRAAARRILRLPPAPPLEIPEFTREQLIIVHRCICEESAKSGMDRAAAEAVANAVVFRLTFEKHRPGVEEGLEGGVEGQTP